MSALPVLVPNTETVPKNAKIRNITRGLYGSGYPLRAHHFLDAPNLTRGLVVPHDGCCEHRRSPPAHASSNRGRCSRRSLRNLAAACSFAAEGVTSRLTRARPMGV